MVYEVSPTPRVSQSRSLNPGEKIGPFEILGQIGAGGTSVILKGQDKLLDRVVAIKQIHMPTGEDASAVRQRVVAAGQLQKKLSEAEPKHLLRLLEIVDEPRGLFLIQEFVDGPSLEQILAASGGPMDPRQALGILAAAATGLKAIHGQGVIHRDLKPSNLLLPRDGGLKVSDFGLATAVAQQQPLGTGSTRYMAPELLRGDPVDARADLYSLGMIAYEMFAGRANFTEAFKPVLRDQQNQAMRWMKWHTNPRLSAPPLKKWVPQLSSALCEIVARLMDKDPHTRIGSAQALLDAIQQHFVGRKARRPQRAGSQASPVQRSVVEPSTGGETAPLPKRRRVPVGWIAAVAAMVVVVAGAAMSVVGWRGQQQDAAQVQAEHLIEQARDAYRGAAYGEALVKYEEVAAAWPGDSSLGRWGRAGALLAKGRLAMAEGRYEAAAEALKGAKAVGVLDAAMIDGLLGEIGRRTDFDVAMRKIEQTIAAQQFGPAREQLQQWIPLTLSDDEEAQLKAVSEKLEDQQTQWERQQLLEQAQELVKQDRREEAIAMLAASLRQSMNRGAQELYDELVAERNYEQAIARGDMAEEEGELAAAIGAYREAQAIKPDDAMAEKLAELQAEAAIAEGRRLLEAGDAASAEAAFARALGYHDHPQAKEILGQLTSSSQAAAFVRAGDEAMAGGDFDAAVAQFEHALEAGPDELVEARLVDAQVRWRLKEAATAFEAGELERVTALLEEARALGPEHPEVAAVADELAVRSDYQRLLREGDAARDGSDFGAAKRFYGEARRILDTPEVRARLDHAEYDHLIAQARSYMAMAEFASARALLLTAAQIRQTEQVQKLLSEVQQHLSQATP
jgi:tetratricopeptide (TPR) repeat protein